MKKIMIVDDNYLSAEGIEKNIDWETLNAEIVHVCYNGTSAIEAMKKEPVDLIISDIEMPDLDGISMSRQALEINPMVKIILISAYDKFEYARRALLLGALDYIEKPLDYAYLIQKVKNAFALMEKEQKNLQLLKQSRPLLTEKFFRKITHRKQAYCKIGTKSCREIRIFKSAKTTLIVEIYFRRTDYSVFTVADYFFEFFKSRFSSV